jgi:hypothetical protein
MFKVMRGLGKRDVVGEFMRSVFIEVATENYRQLMQESMDLDEDEPLDPPLRANERVMSGLFANAISKVSARSRPEARVDRELDDDPDAENEEGKNSKAGRVDYLAWYGNKTIAVELKVAGINWSSPKITAIAKKRWKGVVGQANTAKNALDKRSNEDKNRYPNPSSIGLLVLVARSAKVTENMNEEEIEKARVQVIEEIKTEIKNDDSFNPEIISTYTFPSEFRDFIKKRKGKENIDKKISSTPFVVFLAYLAK